jgi:hypothetical protein
MILCGVNRPYSYKSLSERICSMPQHHPSSCSLVICLATLLTWMSIISQDLVPALAEDFAELSLATPNLSQTASEQAPQSSALFLHAETDLIPDFSTSTWSPVELEKEMMRAESSPLQAIAPSLSWEGQGQTGENLFVYIQPHFTRDPVETARSPVDRGESYQKSPLNSNDLIYGLGVGTDYELAPWLHFNSSFRFDLHNARSNPGSSAAAPGDSTSHSLFFGVTVPFPTSSEE